MYHCTKNFIKDFFSKCDQCMWPVYFQRFNHILGAFISGSQYDIYFISQYFFSLIYLLNGNSSKFIWDALRDLAPFAQFKKREKYPWGVSPLVRLQAAFFREAARMSWMN